MIRGLLLVIAAPILITLMASDPLLGVTLNALFFTALFWEGNHGR